MAETAIVILRVYKGELRRAGVRRLSRVGSVARDDAEPGSDEGEPIAAGKAVG